MEWNFNSCVESPKLEVGITLLGGRGKPLTVHVTNYNRTLGFMIQRIASDNRDSLKTVIV